MQESKEDTVEEKSKPASHTMLPDYRIADLRHELLLPSALSGERRSKAAEELMCRIKQDGMSHFYRQLCENPIIGWTLDRDLLQIMEEANAREKEALEAKIADARENYGDTEVRDAVLNRAHFYCRIGDKETARVEYEQCYEKGVGAGSRLDSLLTLIRLGLLTADVPMVHKYIHKAKNELEKGGDWERRNKLKVYEGVELMVCRDFDKAANLLTDSIATFTATELLSFTSLIFYSVTLSMLAMDRRFLRSKVVQCPEVLQVLEEDPELKEFLMSYFECRYLSFMHHLVPIAHRVQRDRYLGKHYRYFIRTIRLRAYSQFLEPYRSVTLASMAEAFGVGPDFIENEVSSFIASGKLNCKIDKVGGVVESNRQDRRNQLYLDTIKHGDLLLNRVQKLSRVIDM